MRDRSDPHESTADRRRFLRALGAVGIVGFAGCGGDGDGTESPTEADGDGTESPTEADTTDVSGTDTRTVGPDPGTPEPTDEPTETPEPQPLEPPRDLLSFSSGSVSTTPGGTATIEGSLQNSYLFDLQDISVTLSAPDGWTVTEPEKTVEQLEATSSESVSWEVSVPDDAIGTTELTATVVYASTTDENEVSLTTTVSVFDPGNIEQGQRAYYSLDGSTATNSVTGTDATVIGNPTPEATGQVGNAFSFSANDGPDTGGDFTPGDGLTSGEELSVNGEGATVAAWVNYTDDTETNGRIFQVGGPPDGLPSAGFDVEIDSSGAAKLVGFKEGGPDTQPYDVGPQISLSSETWYYVVAVVDGEQARLHTFDTDGQLDDSPATATVERDQGNGAVLHLSVGDGQDLDGRLDEVRAFSRALPAGEVGNLYGIDG